MRALPFLLTGALIASCGPAAPAAAADPAEARAEAAAPAADFEARLAAIAKTQEQLGARYAGAGAEAARAAVRAEARAYLLAAIVGEIFPAWLGMPWGLGPNSTATRPHQPGMTVACGYFVAAVLENAGLRLSSRFKFAQAPALTVQEALAEKVHRFYSIPGEELAAKIAALGEGLYIIGLNIHIGFVVVDGRGVRLVHASYTDGQVVTDEPLASAAAIANSREKGYFVSPVLSTRTLDLWLRGARVPLQRG